MNNASSSAVIQENLVSSRAEDNAVLLDPNFINAWGLALRPAGLGGHWWVTNTDTSRVTLYVGDSPTVPFGQDGLSVIGVAGASGGTPVNIAIDPPTRDGVALPPANPAPATVMSPSAPTGQVFSGSATDFLVSGTSLTGSALNDAPARFITVSEDGTIAAWGEAGSTPGQRMNAFAVVVDNSATGAIYKGVTVSSDTGSGNTLYAANFSQGRIDVFDSSWQPVTTSGFVAEAPGGRDLAEFSPFNIERVFDSSRGEDVLIVVYAKLANAAGGEEESTDGFIAKFTLDGTFIAASDGGGLFNAPWGVAVAPDSFGAFSGTLLIGNFGDGHIVSLDIASLEPEGYLLGANGEPATIDGLWDIAFGNGESLGASDSLYFAAGPEEESQGLFGSLSVAGDGEDAMTFAGTAGNDTKSGGAGDDRLNGRDGNDVLLGQRGDDTLNGGNGNDKLFGGYDDDQLSGGDGRDSLYGGRGDDLLRGGDGRDQLNGGTGEDRLYGDDGYDTLDGGEGDDRLRGGDGRDVLNGGSGEDRLQGDDGYDTLDGGEGDDRLGGGDGRDVLNGGAGQDRLSGDDGYDTIDGGAGHDTLTGGNGNDTFVFAGAFGNDRITDFDGRSAGGQDYIDLSAFGITSANFASHVMIQDIGCDTLVTVAGGGTIRLSGVSQASTITQSDFIF